ncbi:MAG: hypothetical protein HBSIN02_12810 [Bacteroidia bacterium]|nr:MAG: hypothetical protein HBSIN02_12810 [Bacteroidia bacterium]
MVLKTPLEAWSEKYLGTGGQTAVPIVSQAAPVASLKHGTQKCPPSRVLWISLGPQLCVDMVSGPAGLANGTTS